MTTLIEDQACLCMLNDEIKMKLSGCAGIKFILNAPLTVNGTTGNCIVVHSNLPFLARIAITNIIGNQKPQVSHAIFVFKGRILNYQHNGLSTLFEVSQRHELGSDGRISVLHEVNLSGDAERIKNNQENRDFFTPAAPKPFEDYLRNAVSFGFSQEAKIEVAVDKLWISYTSQYGKQVTDKNIQDLLVSSAGKMWLQTNGFKLSSYGNRSCAIQ